MTSSRPNHLADTLAQLSSRAVVVGGGEGFCIWISGETVQSIAPSKVVKVKGWSCKRSNHQFGGGRRISRLVVQWPLCEDGWSNVGVCLKQAFLLQAIQWDPGEAGWQPSLGSFPSVPVVKNLPARARDEGSVPRLRRSPGEGNGSPLKYPCLGNLMDRGAWQATVHGVAKSQMWLSN